MKFDEFEKLSPLERREFLKFLGGFMGASMFNPTLKFSMLETLIGPAAAQAQTTGQPINFLEVNFRDQWDFGHIFVPPSVARNYDSIKSRIALFDQPIQERNGFYVTPQAEELRPHLDSIAVMELGECTLSGNESIHGHEAGNPLRSPGRSKQGGAGRADMATQDKRPGTGGNEVLYSSTPTPLVLHNYYQRQQSPALSNGALLRSSVRSGTHTYYHFEAGLSNAQVDRYFDRNTFLRTFNNTTPPTPTMSQKHGALITNFLKKFDLDYLRRAAIAKEDQFQHNGKLTALNPLLQTVPEPVKLELSSNELTYWKNGITDQLECPGDDAAACFRRNDQWHVGELFAYAFKLFQSGRVRSVGIDFDVSDVHTNRTPFLLRTQAQQSGMTLARLIQSLKNANLYNNTVIAMYTLDGSRSPLLSSTGEGTKNALVLAGGMIKGGYYGDIKVSNNGTVTYHRPDDSGTAIADGTTGRDKRVSAADVYRTVAKAAGLPDSLVTGFTDVRDGKVLNYMLRS